MRAVLLSFVMLFALAGARSVQAVPASTHAAAISAPAQVFAVQEVSTPKIDISVNNGGHAWYRSPVWIAIGVIALVVLVLIVAMIARGGGTTIIRD